MIEQIGTIVEIIFRNEENGYTVAVFETETEYFTIVGNLSTCSVGKKFRLEGEFITHRQYGEQFSFSSFEELLPSGEGEIFAFLSSGQITGVGEKMAAAMISAWGKDTLKVIDEHPEKLTDIPGIGPAKAANIIISFRKHREFADISLKLQHYGISTEQALKIYKEFGTNTVKILEENPYQIIGSVRGFGFEKADNLREKLGIAKEDPSRIKSGILYFLVQSIGQGHTYMEKAELIDRSSLYLDVSAELLEEQLLMLALDGKIKLDIISEMEVVYLISYYLAEKKVAHKLKVLDNASIKSLIADIDSLILASEGESKIELSEEQKVAIRNTITSGVSVITGGPGTGKTTIINTIISVFDGNKFKTAIAAPTGRAAKRITETSGYPASTIHRLLEYYYSEDSNEMRFGKTEEDPLDYDVVIIDEASMIDLMLMDSLLEAITPGTRLILVGDKDQLPSVGAGNVLGDIIKSEYIYTSELKQIFRQAKESLIVTNAHKINKGEQPILNQGDKDFFLLRQNSETEIRKVIKELITKRLPKFIYDLSPIDDIQVITPTKKGNVGTVKLNEILQEALNGQSEDKNEKHWGGKIFREGDKVMQMTNNYQLEWVSRTDLSEGKGIFNGDVGHIETIDNKDASLTVIFDDDKAVKYGFSDLEQLELAYAVTVHKSQGSEFPVVIMPISRFPKVLATRNLLYTAVTRGKSFVVLVGDERCLMTMVANNEIVKRNSGLAYRLKEYFTLTE